jgi:hypothetical protein
MTDKATMPEYNTYDLKANIRTYIPDFDMASEIMVRLQTLDSLAAVAQRMHDHLTGRGSTLKDRSDVIDEYNALMKGR